MTNVIKVRHEVELQLQAIEFQPFNAVQHLDAALEGKQILIAPNSPSRGVRVAFILDDGALIELLEFDGPDVRDIRTSSPDC